MTPTIVFDKEGPVLATGSPGGSRIINSVLQVILNTVDFGMNIALATASPRIHHQWLPDSVYFEQGISRDTVEALESLGHTMEEVRGTVGKTQSITRENEVFYGSTDYRWPGGGAVSPSHLE